MQFSRLLVSVFLVLSLEQTVVNGFSVVPSSSSAQRSLVSLAADVASDAESSSSISKKPMSPEEIKARMREKHGLPEDEDEIPKLFSEEIYDDIQQALLIMEKRVKDGPGSVSMLEVEEFVGQTQRIMEEMKQFESGRLKELPSAEAPPPSSMAIASAEAVAVKAAAASADSETTAAGSSEAAPGPQAAPAAAITTPAAPEAEEGETRKIIDTSNDDLLNYDGTGGMGLAKGTANTYVIEGMDAMSPEEYQDKLQQSIINRQKDRKGQGNRATWDYLNQLTGESGVLKDDIAEGEDEEMP